MAGYVDLLEPSWDFAGRTWVVDRAGGRARVFVVNDGAAQRSMVKSVTVNFGGAAVLDPGAVELRRRDGTVVNSQLAVSTAGGRTAAVLTFAAPEFVGGSLADGTYTLTVHADRVHDRWGRELDGDADGSAGGDFASNLGPKILAAGAGLAFVVTLGLFVKIAWDNNWVGPTGRVLSGAVFGLGLLASGVRSMRREYRPLGQALAGAGLQHLAEDHFLDIGALYACSLDRCLDGDLAEFRRRQA